MSFDLRYKQQKLSRWKKKDVQGHVKQKRINWVAHANRKREEAGTLLIWDFESIALSVLSLSQVSLLQDLSAT